MARAATFTTFRALRHRNFQLFFVGQLISLIGTWMQTVALSWLVYRLTGSAALLGLVSFAGQIPLFLLSPIAGYAADRFNRHRIMISTQCAAMVLALILAFLTLAGRIATWEIFLLSILLGIVSAFDIPARQSFFVEIVGREDMMNAIALNSSIFNGARMAGPAIAGILVAKIGEGWCFFGNGISYIAVIVGLLLMKLGPWKPTPKPASAWQTIREGFGFAARNTPFRELLALIGVVSFAGLPYLVLMPIFADQILHRGPQGLGMLMGSIGVGALSASVVLATRTGILGFPRWVAFATLVFPVALVAFSWSAWLWLSCAMVFVTGFCVMLQIGSSNTLMQTIVPDRLRGRVVSLYSMMLMGVSPFGSMVAGFTAEKIGASWTLSIGAVVCFAASCLYASRLRLIGPTVHKFMREQEASLPGQDLHRR